MPATTETYTYAVAYDPITGRQDDTIQAAYYRASDLGDFVEFKNETHAIVFSVRSAHVLCIKRSGCVEPETRTVLQQIADGMISASSIRNAQDAMSCTYWVAGEPSRCGQPSVTTFYKMGACQNCVANAGVCAAHERSIAGWAECSCADGVG